MAVKVKLNKTPNWYYLEKSKKLNLKYSYFEVSTLKKKVMRKK